MAIVTPLYGHYSEETAYLVNDYPYGSLRCRIRYWIESDPKRGYRFVSQTENPKTGRWNAPKKRTYSLLAENLYLDENGHVKASALTEYSSGADALAFCRAFRGNACQRVRVFAAKKVGYLTAGIDHKVVWTINGDPRPESDEEMEKHKADRDAWKEVGRTIDG
jgi:hypothetical protein